MDTWANRKCRMAAGGNAAGQGSYDGRGYGDDPYAARDGFTVGLGNGKAAVYALADSTADGYGTAYGRGNIKCKGA